MSHSYLWRGANFGFLPSLQFCPSLVRPDPGRFVLDVGDNNGKAGDGRRVDTESRHIDAVKSLRAEYATLLPRWKSVALTAEAELQALPHDDGIIAALPWANIKFASYPSHGGSFPPSAPRSKARGNRSALQLASACPFPTLHGTSITSILVVGAGPRGAAPSTSLPCQDCCSII